MADEIGVSAGKAKQFIDDVGIEDAQKFVDEAASESTRIVPKGFAKPALVTLGTGTVAGGGLLAYREQDVRRAEAIANQRKQYSESLGQIIEADLPPDVTRQLAAGAARSSRSVTSPNSLSDDGGIIPDDPVVLIVSVIVLVLVLRYVLDDSGAGVVST
jgi:hypothetical protein